MMLSLLLAASLIAQEQQTIDFRSEGERLDVIVGRLAEMTGSDLTIGAEEHGHYLTISVTDMPLEELLDGIARVTVMSWLPDRRGLRLVPDNARRSEIAAEHAAKRAEEFNAYFQEWLRAQRQALADIGAQTPAMAGGETFAYQSSYMEVQIYVMESIFPYLDVDRIGRLQQGERIVFATDPTRMQVPLRVPAGVTAALTAKVRELNANTPEWRIPPSANDLYRTNANENSSVDKIAIGIKRNALNSSAVSSYDIRLTLYEARAGRYLQHHYSNHYFNSPDPGSEGSSYDLRPTMESLGLEQVEDVRYGDLVTASLESQENSTMRRRFQDHSPAFQEIALDLDKGDPQKQIIAPYFIQLGERNDVQVIANVADRVAFQQLVLAARTDALAPFDSIALMHEMELRGETLYVQPSELTAAIVDRVDREYVSEYIARFRNHRLIPFDAQLDFFRSSNGLFIGSASIIRTTALSSTSAGQNRHAMQLLSRGTNAEVHWILSDGEIPYQQLSAPLRQAVHDMIFNHELGVSLDEREPEADFDDYVMTSSGNQAPAAYEVTEIFGNGIPGDTVLRVRAGETWMFVNAPHRMQQAINVSVVQDLFNYARNRAYVDNAPASMTSNMAKIDEYYIEKANYYGFQLQFNPHFRSSFNVIDLEIGPDAEMHHFTQFPPEIEALVRRATETMRNDPRFEWVFNPQIVGGQRPPP